MGYKKLQLESYFPDTEITRYGFISHMESFIKQLLQNPQTARVDDYLMKFGVDSPKALVALLKRTDPSDETSAILIRKESIKPDEENAEEGKVPKDKFHIKYKLPRKDYMKKMRNLYINMFENYMVNSDMINEINANELDSKVTKKTLDNGKIQYSFGKNGVGLSDELIKVGKDIKKLSKEKHVYIDDTFIDSLDDVYDIIIATHPLTEGAWGKGVLDNDAALDYQTSFFKEVLNKFIIDIQNVSDYVKGNDYEKADWIWSKLGVLIDFLKKYKDNEIHFTDEYNNCVMFARQKLNQLFKTSEWINGWDNPSEMKSKLKHLDKELSTFIYDKNRLNVVGEGTINEDGEMSAGGTMDGMGGATNASSSGQFVQPLFGKPIKRKTIYLTQEQVNYLKEEAELDTTFGDFGYDANALNLDSDDPSFNHQDMIKKSFQGED